MRRAGFSRAKVRSIKDIARKTRSGLIPTRAPAKSHRRELIERLIAGARSARDGEMC